MMLRTVSHVGLKSCDVTSSWLSDRSLATNQLIRRGFKLTPVVFFLCILDRVWDGVEAGLHGSGDPSPELRCIIQR